MLCETGVSKSNFTSSVTFNINDNITVKISKRTLLSLKISFHRGVFRTLSDIEEGAFCENTLQKKSNYFYKTLYLRSLLGF